MTLADLGKYLDLHDVDACNQWSCLHYGRSGTSVRKEGAYQCEACPMSFGTQRGLSAHARHAHPAVRNDKRREADPSNARNWTVEEVNLLKELDELYKDYREIIILT
jgi:ribosome-binding protein aMBF1 (putative translation factor)